MAPDNRSIERSVVFLVPEAVVIQHLLGQRNALWLVILVSKLLRVSLIALKGGIGIIIAYAYYLPLETVIIGYPV